MTISKVLIKSSLIRRFSNVVSPNSFRQSVYSSSFSPTTSFIALLCLLQTVDVFPETRRPCLYAVLQNCPYIGFIQNQKGCFVQSAQVPLYCSENIHSLPRRFFTLPPAFRSFVRITPRSFSSCTSASLHNVQSALEMEYDVASLCPTCMTLHFSILKPSNHLLFHSLNLSKSSCITWLSDSRRIVFHGFNVCFYLPWQIIYIY